MVLREVSQPDGTVVWMSTLRELHTSDHFAILDEATEVLSATEGAQTLLAVAENGAGSQSFRRFADCVVCPNGASESTEALIA